MILSSRLGHIHSMLIRPLSLGLGLTVLLTSVVFVGEGCLGRWGICGVGGDLVHIVESPLQIATNDPSERFVIPAGTTLHYIDSFPEGFQRYIVYVNIEGPPLTLHEVERDNFIAPVSAYPTSKEEKARWTNGPVNEEYIRALLSSSGLSVDELIELVERTSEKAE